MASYGAWASIRKHGLLSSSRLVELFEVHEPRRTELLTTQRTGPVSITHPTHGTAVLRDQKPLSEKNLKRCLVGCDSAAWYELLNERVFFWLDRGRLLTLMSASEYREKQHTVLHVDTARLVSRYGEQIELAHMNTGNTLPFPHRRGPETFRKMGLYDYARRSRLPDYSAVVELTVFGGVEDIKRDVTKVEHAESRRGKYKVRELVFER